MGKGKPFRPYGVYTPKKVTNNTNAKANYLDKPQEPSSLEMFSKSLPAKVKLPSTALQKRDPRLALKSYRAAQPKAIVPGLPCGEDYLILDQRHQDHPEIPLIILRLDLPAPQAEPFVREGHFRFRDLPSELRNQIYHYCIDEEQYGLVWVNGHQKSKTLTYRRSCFSSKPPPNLPRDTPQKRRLLDYHRRADKSQHLPVDSIGQGPTALLFVCKSMSEEAATILYSKCFFHFDAMGTLRHFIDRLRPVTLGSISKLSIAHRAYGNPDLKSDIVWKDRYDLKWELLIERICEACPDINQLCFTMKLNKSAIRFAPLGEYIMEKKDEENFDVQWMRPLLPFRDLENLNRLKMDIVCKSKQDAILELAVYDLRRDILQENWDPKVEKNLTAWGWPKGRGNVKAFPTPPPPQPLVRTLDVSEAQRAQLRRKTTTRRRRVPREEEWGHFFLD